MMNISLPLLAVLSGVSFSAIGVAYRYGQARGITPVQIMFWAVALAIVFFGVRTAPALWLEAPRLVWFWALVGGAGQYGCLLVVKRVLRLGPLSPCWCAVNLMFLVVTLYAAAFLGERISLLQSLGLLCGIGTVLAGVWSIAPAPAVTAPGASVPGRLGQRLEYGLLLVLVMIFNSLGSIGLKALNRYSLPSGGDALSQFQGVFMTAFYLALWLGILADLSFRRAWRRPDSPLFGAAALAGGGSIGGLSLWCLCAELPAMVLFTLSSIASIVAGGLISVLVFREKASGYWFLMMGLAVLTILLLNWK